ncbi:unnamed protein product [Parnassius apollo]|uniref:(apollo) hypothetical protein n=1 Tax=Parnassius apollo TaxID=110799 RepID=A0A8S3WZU4_PARAO|nr:unnamed protein product [Parnassius apollo]
MHRLFAELEPSLIVTEQNLADRVRYILRSNIFDVAELERLRREAVPSSDENATAEDAAPQMELELEHMRSILEEAIVETRSTPLENRPRLPRIALSKRNRAVVRALNPMLVTYLEASRDLCETDSILFGAALAVCRIIGAKVSTAGRATGHSSAIPAWRRRIEERIAKARALIGRLICFRSGNNRPRIVRTVRMAFAGTNVSLSQPDITQKLTERIDDLKQRIAAWGKRIRRYTERSTRFNQNRLFQSDQKRLYESLERPMVSGTGPAPDQADTVAFWRGLWSEPVNHSEGPWTEVVASQCAGITPMDPVIITPDDVAEAVRRAPNWKSPGLDGLHHYWLKGFMVCHSVLARQFQEALNQKSLPSLFTTGITHLVPKDQGTTDPSKYRPITREAVPSSNENATTEGAVPQVAEQPAHVDAAENTPVVADSNDDGTFTQELEIEQMRSTLEEAIMETRSTPLENRPRLPRIALSKRNRAVVRALNPMLVTYLEASRDLCETDSILFGAALAVCRIIGAKLSTAGRTTGQSSAIPAWRTRIEERIAKARALIGRLICFRSGNTRPRIVRTVRMAFAGTNVSLSQPDIMQKLTERIDDLKQRIAAWGKRIRRYTERSTRFNQNRLFQSDQKRLYKSLERPMVSGTGPVPNQADTVAFWRSLWSEPVNHNEGPWTEVVASQCAGITPMDPVTITPGDVAEAVRRAPNWKSPGLDGLHHYWLKGFVVCHTVLARQFQEVLNQKSLPSLFTTGITHLVPKGQRSSRAQQSAPASGGVRRMRWTTQMNSNALRAYFGAKGGETGGLAYRARMHRLFAELEPSLTVTEQNLADRVRYILRSNIFDVAELERLRREAVPSSDENATAEDAAPQMVEQPANVDAAVNTPVVVDSNDDGTVAQEPELEHMRSTLEEAIVETRSTPLENRPRLPRIALSKRNRAVVRALNPMLVTYLEASRDLCETDSILFGAALAVCRIIGAKVSTAGRATGHSSAIPAWRRRIEERIAKARALIGRLICFRSGNNRPRIVRTVRMAFAGTIVSLSQPDITQKLTERIDDLKQRIAAWGKRIRRYTERSTRFNQNRLFQSDQKRLYESLERPMVSGTGPAPNQADTVAFWRGLWSEPVNHSEGPWKEVVASQWAGITPMDPVTITPDDVAEAVRRAPNWKSPGLDGLHHYWLKGFMSDRDDYSEEEYCDDGEAAGGASNPDSSEDGMPLSHFSRHIDSEKRQTGVQVSDSQVNTVAEGNVSQSCRKYYYGKKRCMKWSAEGPSRTTRTPAHNIVTPITTIDFSPDSPPSQLFSLLITDNIKTQIIENTNQKLELIRQKYKLQGN